MTPGNNQPRPQLASYCPCRFSMPVAKKRVSVLARVEISWISAGEDEVFLTVVPLKDELTHNWAHGRVTLHQ